MLRMLASLRCLYFTLGLILVTAAGCGSGPPTNPVSGKVTAAGKTVDGGTLVFAPVATGATALSSPVITTVNPDGTFKVAAGVVVGKQKLTYEAPAIPFEAPPWNGKGAPPVAPKSPWSGYKPTVSEVDIKEGVNDLVIELKK